MKAIIMEGRDDRRRGEDHYLVRRQGWTAGDSVSHGCMVRPAEELRRAC